LLYSSLQQIQEIALGRVGEPEDQAMLFNVTKAATAADSQHRRSGMGMCAICSPLILSTCCSSVETTN
jgi:hypothetical protein